MYHMALVLVNLRQFKGAKVQIIFAGALLLHNLFPHGIKRVQIVNYHICDMVNVDFRIYHKPLKALVSCQLIH